MKRRFFRATLLTIVSWTLVFPTSALAGDPQTREAWVPKSRHGEARTLVDPGPNGLLGEYKLLTLKLPEFLATYQGPNGKLVIQIHPPSDAPTSSANWTGKRVALTVRATTLERPTLEKALAAVIAIVQKREGRWGWLWRPVGQKEVVSAPFAGLYRGLAYGDVESLKTQLRTLHDGGKTELVTLLDGIELAYHAGHQDFAQLLAGQVARNSEEKLARGKQTPSALQANRLLLARAFALAGRLDQLERIQGGILGSASVCKATVVGRALDVAGRKTEAMKFVEEKILGRTTACAPALDLAVSLRLKNDDREGALGLLKLYKGRLTNHPATYLAQARVKLAGGDIDGGGDLLRTALRFNPKEPEVYDLLTTSLFLKRRDLGSLKEAKKQREEKLKQSSAQIYAGVLCATYDDKFCVDAAYQATEEAAREKNALPVMVLGVLSALVSNKADVLEERLGALWRHAPFLVTPLLLERLSDSRPEKPSLQLLSQYASQAYGPGFGRQIQQLASAPTTSSEKTQPDAVGETTAQKEKEDDPSSDTEEDSPFPSWLLLTMGGALAFLGVVGVLRQRQDSQTTTSEE